MRSQRLYHQLVVCICLIAAVPVSALAGDGVSPFSTQSAGGLIIAPLFSLALGAALLVFRASGLGIAGAGRRIVAGALPASVMFAIFGLALAFGRSAGLPFGTVGSFQWIDLDTAQLVTLAILTATFLAAAISVALSIGARIGLLAHIVISSAMSALILAIFANWVWGDILFPNPTAFLARLHFIDIGGSAVIHSTLGWMTLATLMVFGNVHESFRDEWRRSGGEQKDASPTVMGKLLPSVGLFGLAAVMALLVGEGLWRIISNVALAASAGAISASLLQLRRGQPLSADCHVAGALAGVAAISAGCALVGPLAAAAVGVIGSLLAVFGDVIIRRKLKVQDGAGTVGIHGVAGAGGILLVALFVPAGELPAGGRLAQIWVQTVGAGINFYWSFGVTYLVLVIVRRFVIRPSMAAATAADDSPIGREGIVRVENALARWLDGGDVPQRMPVIAGDPAGRLTDLVNRLMEQVEEEKAAWSGGTAFPAKYDEAERVAALARATFEAILIHRNGIVVDGNEELEKLVGRPLTDLVGRSIFEFLRDGQAISVTEVIKRNDNASHEISIILPSGEEIPVAARGRDILFRGEKARVGCFVDLRERKRAEQRIRHLAQHDPLTSLPNRVLFTENLDEMVRLGNPCGVAVVDIDRFKDINDIHGHQAGDAVIREVSRRLMIAARTGDIVARLAGDEFAVIVDKASSIERLEAFGNRVLAAMATPIEIRPGEQVSVTVSIGTALFPDHAHQTDALIGCADMGLEHAKQSGRNACRSFRSGMNDLIEKRRALEADLELGLGRGEFELYLQPRVDVADVAISGYEALLRWNHPKRSMVSPGDFIPVAEASGKIIQLGEWVLAEAARLLGKVDGHISVNVSPLQFRHSDFVANLAQLLRRTGADPRRIELEITESVLIDDDSRALQILQELKRMGFAIALDDFGTGYSSLSYLSRYPFDTIKIDRSFVANLRVADSARMIVKTIIDLGAGLGMRVVAEGVETMEEALFLGGAGCHELQGYLLGRPSPLEDVVRSLDRSVVVQLEQMPKWLPEIPVESYGAARPRLVGSRV